MGQKYIDSVSALYTLTLAWMGPTINPNFNLGTLIPGVDMSFYVEETQRSDAYTKTCILVAIGNSLGFVWYSHKCDVLNPSAQISLQVGCI